MRKFILAAILACSVSHADTLAFLENKTGGVIVITDQATDCRGYPGAAYSTHGESNRTLWGCWYSDDIRIHIDWHDGSKTSYASRSFTTMPENIRRWAERRKGNSL